MGIYKTTSSIRNYFPPLSKSVQTLLLNLFDDTETYNIIYCIMNRRIFLHFGFLSTLLYSKWLFIKNQPIKVTYRSIPKFKNLSTFHSAEDFFQNFYGNQSASFVWKNIKNKKILNLKRRLSPNKKEVFSEFIMKDFSSFIECMNSYSKKISPPSDPIDHRIINITSCPRNTKMI